MQGAEVGREPDETRCNEFPDNGQEHWIGKVSDAQTKAVKVAPEVLAKYVGVYKGIYLRNGEAVEVTLSDGCTHTARSCHGCQE